MEGQAQGPLNTPLQCGAPVKDVGTKNHKLNYDIKLMLLEIRSLACITHFRGTKMSKL